MSNAPFLSRHHSVITNRITFETARPPPLPITTSRVDFGGKWDLSTGAQPSPSVSRSFREYSRLPAETMSAANAPVDASSSMDCYQGRKKVPKPQGEPGRPHSGGYTLTK
ncbi:hypothetical protein CVT26_010029, partial [Gymnopilus dilepis]